MLTKGVGVIGMANGWSITMVGMLTVFIGLLGLFIFISQLHKLIILWEKKPILFKKLNLFSKKQLFPGDNKLKNVSPKIREQARQLYILARFLGEEFNINELIEFAQKRDIVISNDCIQVLKEKSIIIPLEKNIYYWNE